MPLPYGYRLKGISHKNSGTDCQDFFAHEKTSAAIIAAVADGIGSETHSAFGSRTASEAVVSFCKENIHSGMNGNDILRVIYDGFDQAWRAVEQGARDRNFDVRQCNTTLTAIVFIEGEVYYGHAGDSGIFAFFEDGKIEPVTTQQRDSDGRVYTLSAGPNKWEFNKASQKAVSLLLCTDGVWGMFFPARLADENEKHSVPLLAWYIDPEAIKAHSKGEGFQKWLEADMEGINTNNPGDVDFDDITIVIVHNDQIPHQRQKDSYYEPPTTEELEKAKKAEHKRLYGHLENSPKKDKPTSERMTATPVSPTHAKNQALPGEKSLEEACKYDEHYWLTLRDRIDLAKRIFFGLAQNNKKHYMQFPLDIYLANDKKTQKSHVRLGEDFAENKEIYYRIIRQVARLLTNGLALPSPKSESDLAPEKEFLSDGLYNLFFESCTECNNKRLMANLPKPENWQKEIEIFSSTQIICVSNPEHSYNKFSATCPWCKIDEHRKK